MTTDEYLERRNQSVDQYSHSYSLLVKQQMEYDKKSSELYDKGCPKNGIADRIIKLHPQIYEELCDLKIQLNRAESEMKVAEKYYHHHLKKGENEKNIDKQINLLYSGTN